MPTFFDNIDINGDNIYFYDDSDNLYDMVGWNTPHNQGEYMARVPDAFGAYRGYNDVSSQAAGWVFDNTPTLLLTEFQVDATNSMRVELHNPRGGDKILSTRWSIGVGGGPAFGSWTPANEIIRAGGYTYFDWGSGANPNLEGDTISLYYQGTLIEEVSYGTQGPAPDPMNGESTARWFNDTVGENAYSDLWNREMSPTFGLQNTVPPVELTPYIVINELMFNPSIFPNGKYIVIMNTNPGIATNIEDYYIVCDGVYRLSNFGNIDLYPWDKFILRYDDDLPATASLFDNMDVASDNVYLYDDTGQLLDMVGWNTPHLLGMSARRTPEGFGTHQGYDDVSSESAGWVFNSPLEVLITEISDSGSPVAQIEVYNPQYPPIDYNVGFTIESKMGQINGDWGYNPTNYGDYVVFNVTTPGGLDLEGDTISLFQNGYLIEEISYGQMGVVPDPLPDESVQRLWSGTDHSTDWVRNWTTGPNFGAHNNVPPPSLSSPVVLNEVMFNPGVITDHVVELYSLNSERIDISEYKLVCNSEYIFPNGTILDIDARYSYLIYGDDNSFFQNMNPQGDNIYLYNSNGSLVDMVGWSSPHTQDKTVCRIPDGFGLRNGYEDTSSMLAGWQFDQTPLFHLVRVGPDSEQYALKNTTISYYLRVLNLHDNDDLVDIDNTSLPWGFGVNIYDQSGNPLTDSNGNGLPDILVPARFGVMIMVNITIPDIDPLTVSEKTIISIQSAFNSFFKDFATLTTKVYPYITANKSVSTLEINIFGTGWGEKATITLNVTGNGYGVMQKFPQDVVFCIDSSGSMGGNDPDGLRLEAAKSYVDNMILPDRGAVVDFDLNATLLHSLSTNYNQIKNDIDTIDYSGGTNIGLGLKVANDELISNGDPDHIWVIILLTDGNGGNDLALIEAIRSANNSIKIYTVGLGAGANHILLGEIANITGGQYFFAETPEDLVGIYLLISTIISDVAGTDLDITDANPMIRDVLPSWIDYVPGSFSIEPDVNYTDSRGYTFLEWNVSKILLSKSWIVTFDITSTRPGWQLTNEVLTSRVNYTNWNNESVTLLFPKTQINVLTGKPVPPKLFIQVIPDGKGEDIKLNWTPVGMTGISHYLLYRSTSQTGFDFSNVWVNTSRDNDNGNIPLRTTWNDTQAASDFAPHEYYYIIRSVTSSGDVSSTSRTVGKWTKTFQPGVSTFSLPLEPIQDIDAFTLTNDMGADYIKWMDPGTHAWIQHDLGDSVGVDNSNLYVGKGYEVKFGGETTYTFCGMPGGMILYDDVLFGFDADPITGNSDSLTAMVNIANRNVDLTWDAASGIDSYYIFNSTKRDGFFGTLGVDYFLLATTTLGNEFCTHPSAAVDGSEQYYVVIPFLSGTGEKGVSTYSIGVWTAEYLSGYDTLGIPLKLSTYQTADWFCDNIPDTVGVNHYDTAAQRWLWHSTGMPEGAFDVIVEMGVGYKISTSGPTKFTFIGI
jgi:hypothetical protein